MDPEHIHAAVIIIIGNIHAHAGLCSCIPAQGQPGDQGAFLEGTIATVEKEIVRFGIIRHIEIEIAVIINISPDDTQSGKALAVQHTGLLGNIRERSISVIAV